MTGLWIFLVLLAFAAGVLAGSEWTLRRLRSADSLPTVRVTVNDVPPPGQEMYDADRRSLPHAKTRPTRVSSGSYETTSKNPRRWN